MRTVTTEMTVEAHSILLLADFYTKDKSFYRELADLLAHTGSISYQDAQNVQYRSRCEDDSIKLCLEFAPQEIVANWDLLYSGLPKGVLVMLESVGSVSSFSGSVYWIDYERPTAMKHKFIAELQLLAQSRFAITADVRVWNTDHSYFMPQKIGAALMHRKNFLKPR